MRSGILLIDKPAGMTSAGVVARVKRALGAQKVGHAGTLDPDATGLLVCLLNQATRVASYAVEGTKVYSGFIRLGVRTSTDDISGEILSESLELPSYAQIEDAARRFVGVIHQVPPKVSALKVQGRRAYDLHRTGVEFELKGRDVVIHSLVVDRAGEDTARCSRVRYRVECSPGTYVRALARDIGDVLGCGATVESIRREGSGPLRVEMGISLEAVGWEHVRDWIELVPHLPRILVDSGLLQRLRQGRGDALRDAEALLQRVEGIERVGYCVYQLAGDPPESMGILSVEDGKAAYCVTMSGG